MSLINREDLIAEYDRVHVGAPGGARKLMVDAPEMRRRQTMFWNAARNALKGRTPQCRQKSPSSAATSAFTIQSSGEAE